MSDRVKSEVDEKRKSVKNLKIRWKSSWSWFFIDFVLLTFLLRSIEKDKNKATRNLDKKSLRKIKSWSLIKSGCPRNEKIECDLDFRKCYLDIDLKNHPDRESGAWSLKMLPGSKMSPRFLKKRALDLDKMSAAIGKGFAWSLKKSSDGIFKNKQFQSQKECLDLRNPTRAKSQLDLKKCPSKDTSIFISDTAPPYLYLISIFKLFHA